MEQIVTRLARVHKIPLGLVHCVGKVFINIVILLQRKLVAG